MGIETKFISYVSLYLLAITVILLNSCYYYLCRFLVLLFYQQFLYPVLNAFGIETWIQDNCQGYILEEFSGFRRKIKYRPLVFSFGFVVFLLFAFRRGRFKKLS